MVCQKEERKKRETERKKDVCWWHIIQIILKTGLHEDQSISTWKLYHTDCKQFTEFKLVLHIQKLQNNRKHIEI